MNYQLPPSYPEDPYRSCQRGTPYPNGVGHRVPQPQAGYQGQMPASPYPGQSMYPQQPGYAGNNPYAAPPQIDPYSQTDPYKDKAITGLVLGIVALSIGLVIPLIGVILSIPCSIVGIILSSRARRRSPAKRTTATAGLVLSIIAITLVPLIYIPFFAGILAYFFHFH